MDAVDTVLAYHERTKHHFHRYAQALGYLDWATQPDPFRRYAGAPLHKLPLTGVSGPPAYDELFRPGAVAPQAVTLRTIAQLFEFSLALSAWKQYKDTRWALRINPSSGNLHPTEGYLIAGPIDGLHTRAAVYHYAPKEHALERRADFDPELWRRLIAGLPAESFLIALTSIHWRESWKYGERAYRYCQHDAGHAIAAVALSAGIQGWQTSLLNSPADADVSRLLGLDRQEDYSDAEHETPDAMMAIVPHSRNANLWDRVLDASAIMAIADGRWSGNANRLSTDHVDWEIIDSAASACRKPTTPPSPADDASFPQAMLRDSVSPAARQIILQRRSAVAFDGVTSISAAQFFLMLDRVLPRWDLPPWQTLGPPVCIHLALFVHLVNGLTPGLYFLVRNPTHFDDIRKNTNPKFEWTRANIAPDHLPLYVLIEGDARHVAGQVSCGQDIAAESAFSLGMIAEFEEPLRSHGAWFYRRLHWEAGAIGQVLYLEAEAAGVRATGIGCFFDDPVHELLGLRDRRYQTIYHFTVGGHVEDTRLTSLPPYPLQDSK
jgi:SagB-type dehydrogenase family enzyme